MSLDQSFRGMQEFSDSRWWPDLLPEPADDAVLLEECRWGCLLQQDFVRIAQ